MTREIRTLDEYHVWQLEQRLLLDLVSRVEAEERANLKRIRCPVDPRAIYSILNGEPDANWPKSTSARNKRRAINSMYVLLHLEAVRRHVTLGDERPALAARAALLAGLYFSTSAAVSSAWSTAAKRGGHVRAAMVAAEAASHDDQIRRLYVACLTNEDIREDYPRSPVPFITGRTGIPAKTVQRRLTILFPDWPRKYRESRQ